MSFAMRCAFLQNERISRAQIHADDFHRDQTHTHVRIANTIKNLRSNLIWNVTTRRTSLRIYSGELLKLSQYERTRLMTATEEGTRISASKPALAFALEDRRMIANEVRMTWLTKPRMYTLAGSHCRTVRHADMMKSLYTTWYRALRSIGRVVLQIDGASSGR